MSERGPGRAELLFIAFLLAVAAFATTRHWLGG